MTVADIVRIFAEGSSTAVVLTDARPERPGPTILYVNPAFCRMTGYDVGDVIGQSPRLLQGKATNPLVLRSFAKALRAGKRFHGFLANYRKDGEEYICEVDVRPVFAGGSQPDYFISFEREVRRARGRPGRGGMARFKPLAPLDLVDTDLFTPEASPEVVPAGAPDSSTAPLE